MVQDSPVKRVERGFSERGNVPTVLVVEDDGDIRELARDFLQMAGYHVLTAADGSAALALLEQERVDVLFTDIVMPGPVSGIVVAEEARQRSAEIAVLYTSGYTLHPSVTATAAWLRGDFLPKPYLPSELLTRVRALLEAVKA